MVKFVYLFVLKADLVIVNENMKKLAKHESQYQHLFSQWVNNIKTKTLKFIAKS